MVKALLPMETTSVGWSLVTVREQYIQPIIITIIMILIVMVAAAANTQHLLLRVTHITNHTSYYSVFTVPEQGLQRKASILSIESQATGLKAKVLFLLRVWPLCIHTNFSQMHCFSRASA